MGKRTNTNLFDETITTLKNFGKTEKDVYWIGTVEYKFSWDQFAKIAINCWYDSGYGSPKVATNLVIVGSNWWLSRKEYDGAEWWSYNEKPIEPINTFELKALSVNQAEELGFDVNCGWETLEDLNGLNTETNKEDEY